MWLKGVVGGESHKELKVLSLGFIFFQLVCGESHKELKDEMEHKTEDELAGENPIRN